ncbi:MAG: dihydropyrimidinase [Clostridia bacterium]
MLLIQNGTLVTEQGILCADLAVADGKIAKIAAKIEASPQDEQLDATGLLVFPGFIDGHTHLDMDNGITVTADNFATGTRAALVGGTTTLVDFATQDRGDTLSHALSTWHQKAEGQSSCHYAFHMAITDWNARTKAELEPMFAAGVSSFKLYLAYDALRVSDESVFEVLTEMKRLGGVVGVHCENGDLVNACVKREKALGHLSPAAHPVSRPPIVEAEAINRLLAIAKLADCTVHVVHLSSEEGLFEVRKARARGQRVFVETCPQYLLLNDEHYLEPDFASAQYVCSPPLRKANDQRALLGALLGGEIDTISTDHCSYTLAQKAIGKEDFSKIPNGLPGIEHRPQVIYAAYVDTGKLPVTTFCELLATNPARQFGMYPQKGVLRVGSDADLVLWNPTAQTVIHANTQHQNTDYTPYEGMPIQGTPKYVLLDGKIAAKDGQVVLENAGRYISRKPVAV